MRLARAGAALLAGALAGGCAPGATVSRAPSAALAPSLTDAIGMEMVLIQPGATLVGRFQPVCPVAGPTGTPTFAGTAPARPPGAGAGGAGGGAAGGAATRPPPDPHTLWTAADAALCEQMSRRDATPGFQVAIDHPFYLGKYEVTQAQWKRVMGSNPSVFQGSRVKDDADRHPVENVTWAQARAFLARLNRMDRTAHYRLPTEFEWEYAARAGTPGEPTWAAAREQAATGLTTLPVGSKKPNAWGVYDMFGNVWEWVDDFYNEKMFPDPTPPRGGREHVLKGASFLGDVKNFTPSTHGGGPGDGYDNGFRVVRDAR
jgi:sulfatase modifying factor 1